jgi:hypothetical protein
MEEQNQLDNFFNLSFDAAARTQLKRIALWAKICSISAFVGYALSLAIALLNQVNHTDYALEAEGLSIRAGLVSGSSLRSTVVVIIIGGILNYFLYRFAVAAAQGAGSMDNIRLNEGLSSLRTYFKIFGILMLIVLVVGGLAIVIGILGRMTSTQY